MVLPIEFVCTANHGRSPVAELFANDYLARIGELRTLHAISSGSHVDEIAAKASPLEIKLRFVNLARNRGDVYSLTDERAIDAAIKSGDEGVIGRFCEKAEYLFHQEESSYRAEALRHFGIVETPKAVGEQTVAGRDRVVVLPMARSNLDKVVSIYDAAGFRPPQGIVLFGEYATGDAAKTIPDAFGKGWDDYLTAVETIRECVPKAVERALVSLR